MGKQKYEKRMRDRSRTLYRRETEMINSKSSKSYVWDNRKRAKAPESSKIRSLGHNSQSINYH